MANPLLTRKYTISLVIKLRTFPSKTIPKNQFCNCFRTEKSILVAEFHKTYLEILDHSKDGKSLYDCLNFNAY